MLLLVLRVLDLDVHNDNFAFVKRDRRAIYLRAEEPPIERFTILRLNRPIVVVNGDLAILQVHVDTVRVECGAVHLPFTCLAVLDWHVSRALLDQFIRNLVLGIFIILGDDSSHHQNPSKQSPHFKFYYKLGFLGFWGFGAAS